MLKKPSNQGTLNQRRKLKRNRLLGERQKGLLECVRGYEAKIALYHEAIIPLNQPLSSFPLITFFWLTFQINHCEFKVTRKCRILFSHILINVKFGQKNEVIFFLLHMTYSVLYFSF